MAILWRYRDGDRQYEVRSAGRTRRLYTNGVFHSQYNPARPVTGNIWDLFLLAGLCLPAGAVRRVLMLGVGGGAAIRLLREHLHPEHIVGVDLDAVHLAIARRFFDVRGRDVELISAEAGAWLDAYRGPRFDLIIDDLFDGGDGGARRAVDVDARWADRLTRHLNERGALAVNFTSTQELNRSALMTTRRMRRRFARVLALKTPQNENTVAVLTRVPLVATILRQRLRTLPALARAEHAGRLRYSARCLTCAGNLFDPRRVE